MSHRGIFFATVGLASVVACNQQQSPVAPAESAVPSSSIATSQAQPDLPDAARRTYKVTLENLTTGQPFSPGVVATHTNKVSVFQVGQHASEGIRLIAEDGDPSRAVADLSGAPGIFDVRAVPQPTHRIGGPGASTQVVEIDAAANANRLSLAVMLICTNDGFTGVDSIALPGGFKAESYVAAGYDAGTEANNQLFTHIVDPCSVIGPLSVAPDGQNLRVPLRSVIAHHLNIQPGVGDLVAGLHGWTNPVARITVQRMK